MELKPVKVSGNEAEFEIVGEDYTLGEMICARLNEAKGVEFAAYRKEHPLVSNPVIYVKVKSGSAVKAIASAAEELAKEVAEFKAALKKVK